MTDPFAADLARKGYGVDSEEDDDAPAFLTKGAKSDPFAADLRRKGVDTSADSVDETRPLKNTGPDLAGQEKAIADQYRKDHPERTLADRAKDTISGLADTAAGGARAAMGAAPEVLGGRGVLNTLKSPQHRRELERGLSDMTTLGYAEKAGNAISNAVTSPASPDDGLLTRIIRHGATHDIFGREAKGGLADSGADLEANAQADREAAPDDRALGRALGMVAPGAGTYIAKSAGNVIAPVLSDLQATTRAGSLALGGAKGVAGYAASAPLAAGLSAGASGDRLGAAADALTDPVGLASSAIGGAVSEPIARNLVDHAKSRATKDIAHDIVAAEGPKARATDAKRIADVNDRVFEMTKEMPELRPIWRESAENAAPKIAAIKNKLAEPLDSLYDEVDALTAPKGDGVPRSVPYEDTSASKTVKLDNPRANPITGEEPPLPEATGGGIRLGDIVDAYRKQAKELGKSERGLDDAARLNRLADRMITAAKNRQGEGVVFDPKMKINAEGTTAADQIAMLEKSAARAERAGQSDAAIELQGEAQKVREMASKPAPLNMDERIPTKEFRAEVTSLAKASNDVMGSIEGTPKHEALQRLYEFGKQVIDKHLDESGLDPKKLAQLRKINDQYFLLSRAEEAIKSRGVKEASRPAFDQLIHSPRRALASGAGLGTLGTAVMMSHSPTRAAAEVAGALAVGHGVPAIASRVNWKLANSPGAAAAAQNIAPTLGTTVGRTVGADVGRQQGERVDAASVARLVKAARAGASRSDLQSQAEAFGVPREIADHLAAMNGK